MVRSYSKSVRQQADRHSRCPQRVMSRQCLAFLSISARQYAKVLDCRPVPYLKAVHVVENLNRPRTLLSCYEAVAEPSYDQ